METGTAARAPVSVQAGSSDRPLSLHGPPESAVSTIPRRLEATAGPASSSIRAISQKGGPNRKIHDFADGISSSHLDGGLVDRGGCAGCIDLEAVEQVSRCLQGLVVLGLRRHVGLRAGLLVAIVLQMAGQRGFALDIRQCFQLV